MSSYRAERLTPGMVIHGSRGTCTIVERLEDRQHKRGWMVARYKTNGSQKSFSAPFNMAVTVYTVPAKCECTSIDYCDYCLKRMSVAK